MSRSIPNLEENDGLPGQDSFLDIIANIVGILIILVMVVGVRASHSTLARHDASSAQGAERPENPRQPHAQVASLRAEVKQVTRQITASRGEINTMAGRITSMSQEAQLQDRERIKLSMQRTLIEEDLQKRRARLSETEQFQFDVQRQLTESQIRLDELTREQLALASAPPAVEEIETVTTPLARQVRGEELHLRLKNGLVSIVPIQSLMNEVYPRVENLRRTLQQQGHVVETFGPIHGYRLRLTLSRSSAPRSFAAPVHLQTPGSYLRKNQIEQNFKFLPVSDKLGQNVEQALMPGATLQELLAAHQREATPVTIWVYTDSFDEFRILKRTLWEMHFPVAVRPMAMGDQIGASPHGTRSAAQ